MAGYVTRWLFNAAGVRPVSPLLELVDAAAKSGLKRSVNIWLSANNAYLTVWENGLQMAEVFPDNSLDSILYYMQVIGRRFNLRKFEIRVGGANSALAAHTLRASNRRTRKIRSISPPSRRGRDASSAPKGDTWRATPNAVPPSSSAPNWER